MNQKLNLILIIGSIAILAGIVVLAGAFSGNSQNSFSVYSNSVLTAENNDYDFGTISMANGNVSYKFKLKNEGNEKIIIKKVYTSCMCTTAVIIDESGKKLGDFGMPGHGDDSAKANIEIPVGEIFIVEAIFDPAAHGQEGTGKVKRLVYFETNSKTKPKIQLEIEAEVIK